MTKTTFRLVPVAAGLLVAAGALHADATYGSNPLLSLLPEAGPRGAGAEFRLYATDPDEAAARVADVADAVLLQAATDKPHGLRECVILCSNGYAWVPSRHL